MEEPGSHTDALLYQQPYYHYTTNDVYFGVANGGLHVKVPASLDSTPILQRGGSILPRRDLVRRSSILAWRDPITLVVAADLTGKSASGSLYLDDGESYAYEKGEFVTRNFNLKEVKGKTLVLNSRSAHVSMDSASASYDPSGNEWATKIADVVVREIIILGLESEPSCIKLAGSSVGLDFEWVEGVAATASRRKSGKGASKLIIKDAGASIIQDWDLTLEFGTNSCPTTPSIDYDAALQSPECPTGRFLCRNEGHIPSCILRSRFNDGICDPECCDGSDEADGKVRCANRCQRVGFEHKKKVAEEARKTRVGVAVRKEYETFGAKEKAKLEAEVEKVKEDLRRLEQKEQAAKASLEALENAEAGEIVRKKESVLYQKIVEMQEAIKALREHRTNLEGHISDLSGILSDLSASLTVPFSCIGEALLTLPSTARLHPELPGYGRPRRLSSLQGLAGRQRPSLGRRDLGRRIGERSCSSRRPRC